MLNIQSFSIIRQWLIYTGVHPYLANQTAEEDGARSPSPSQAASVCEEEEGDKEQNEEKTGEHSQERSGEESEEKSGEHSQERSGDGSVEQSGEHNSEQEIEPELSSIRSYSMDGSRSSSRRGSFVGSSLIESISGTPRSPADFSSYNFWAAATNARSSPHDRQSPLSSLQSPGGRGGFPGMSGRTSPSGWSMTSGQSMTSHSQWSVAASSASFAHDHQMTGPVSGGVMEATCQYCIRVLKQAERSK